MKSNIEDITLLDLYIKGNLMGEQKAVLEARLNDEPDLKDDYEYLQKVALDARIVSLRDAIQTIKEVEQEYAHKTKISKGFSNVWIKYLIVAGLILGLMYAGIKYLGNDKPKYPEQYADLFENRFEKELILHVTYRSPGQNDQYKKQQKQAYDLYALKEFKTAIPLLKNLWETERDTLALYYWGVSELGVGKEHKSREILSDSKLSKFNTTFIHKSITK